MKSFDELLDMDDGSRMEYLESEVRKLIAEAPPHNRLKLMALQARLRGFCREYKGNPQARAGAAYGVMLDGLIDLNDTLQGLIK